MKAESIRIDGKRVRYRAAGEGPHIVIIPGLGLSSRFYLPNIEGLAQQGLRVTVPDLPGFGGTHGKLFGLTIPEATDFMIRFANHLHIRKAVWIGHSIGCQVALLLAAQHPERTNGLVLTGPTGAGTRRLLHQTGALMRVAIDEGIRVLGAVARDYIRTTPFHYIGWWLKAARDYPLDHAAQVRAPTLLLIGSEDPVPPGEFIAQLQQRLQQGSLERVAGGYHAVPMEKPAEFNRIVGLFTHRNSTA
jgi:2-hydroxy-6-oxonona-2,4-dienedioate hydrolase